MHVVEAPGAKVVVGQEIAPAVGSVTATVVRVTVPVFLTRNDQVIVSPRSVLPSPFRSLTAADLVSCNPLAWTIGVSVEDPLEVTVAPLGLLPDARRRVGDHTRRPHRPG